LKNGYFWQISANKGLIWHVVHKICNYKIIFRKLDILPVKTIPISTCYTSGRGTVKFFWVWPLHYQCSDRYALNTRFSEVVGLLEEVGFQSTPKLSFGNGGRAQMSRKTVPYDRSGNAETSFAKFRCWRNGHYPPRAMTPDVSLTQNFTWRMFAPNFKATKSVLK